MENTAIQARRAFEPFGNHGHEREARRTCEELVGHLSYSDIENVVQGAPHANEELLVQIYLTRSSRCAKRNSFRNICSRSSSCARGAPRAFEPLGHTIHPIIQYLSARRTSKAILRRDKCDA
eukprot:6204619-Pleurochrysis_carterae.AAC.1